MKLSHAVLLLAFVLAFCNTWGYDLWAPDEPYFGEGAREMVADGQWLIPHVNGAITTDKPPLFFWLIALLSWPVSGVTSLTARLPSVLASIGSVALTMHLGRRMGGERTGAWAGVFLASSYLFWDKSRTAQIEAVLCFLILGALSAFAAFRAGELDGRRAGALFWVAGGLATLAKGPVGILLPLGVALTTLTFDRNLGAWRRFAPWLGPLAFVVVVGSWAVPAVLFGGDYSLWGAVNTHFLQRGLHGMHHKNPIIYYLYMAPAQFLPWAGLLPAAVFSAWRRRRAPTERLLLAWALFVLVFFTISGERRNLYILPMFPALALMSALAVGRALGWGGPKDAEPRASLGLRWVTLPQGLLGGLFVVLAAALPLVAGKMTGVPPGSSLIVAPLLGLVGFALLVWVARGRAEGTLGICAGGVSVVYLVVATALFPAFNAMKSSRPFALQMRDATTASRAAGEEVVACRTGNLPEALAFYSHVYTRETNDDDALAAHLSRPGEVFAVADERSLAALPPDVRRSTSVLRRADLYGKTIVLLVNRPGRDGA